MRIKLAYAAAVALALALPTSAGAQSPGTGIVTIYHAAPGQQLALLKWLAQQERIAAAAGVPASQLYVHTDGDSWDYMMIAPVTTAAQDAALDAAAAKMGLGGGLRAPLELRKHVTSHTDTFVRGPMSVGAYLGMLGEK